MSEIINRNFAVGDRFKGRIDKSILEIVDLKKGGIYNNKIYVTFRDEKTNKTYETDFETAKRLLIDKI